MKLTASRDFSHKLQVGLALTGSAMIVSFKNSC